MPRIFLARFLRLFFNSLGCGLLPKPSIFLEDVREPRIDPNFFFFELSSLSSSLFVSSTTNSGSSVGSSVPLTLALMTCRHNSAAGEEYFVLMECGVNTVMSIPPFSAKNCLHLSFPPALRLASCWGVQESIFTERTKEMWVPRLRCCPLHSRQTKTERVTEHHSGDILPQSMHRSLPGIAFSWAWSLGLIIIKSVFDLVVEFVMLNLCVCVCVCVESCLCCILSTPS
mmetsp:Transcript_7532/g.18452  ORF Transcript_7532/g.18452 Transcript_7532/m.18452 type:complete len:228 (+) Transcript_7532:561-1244(+)